jgi:general secretion pathway protein G
MVFRLENDRAGLVRQGFTIVEVLVVLALIAVFMAVVGPRIAQLAFGGEQNTTRVALKGVQQAIEAYKLNLRKYPETLRDLYKRPADEKKWNGPYLEKEEDPVDAWEVKLQYKRTPGGKHPYELYSYGVEGGSSETPEDQRIDVWEI